MSRKTKDVSGLWETPPPAAAPDRSPGIAPPPRRAGAPAAPARVARPTIVPDPPEPNTTPALLPSTPTGGGEADVSSDDRVVTMPTRDTATEPDTSASAGSAVKTAAQTAPRDDSEEGPMAVKTGLSFTKEQTTKLHKAADKADAWLGDHFGTLLSEHAAAIRATPVARRSRSRNGSNYIASSLYLDAADRELLDELAETTGRSRASIGRMVMDMAGE